MTLFPNTHLIFYRTNLAQNLSTSIIPIVAKKADAKRTYNQPVIPWELDLSEEDEDDGFSESSPDKTNGKEENSSINENSLTDVSDR